MDDPLLTSLTLFIVFVTVAALVGIAVRRFPVPYSVALVAVGLVVGVAVPGLESLVTSEVVLVILLPGLVFEAALRIDLNALRHSLGSVVFLAVPGVLVVAGVAAFKKLGVPGELAVVTEGESLFNDGAGLVLFALTVGALTTAVTAVDVVETLVVTIVVSLIIGVTAGYLASLLLRLVDDHLIELSISISVAYGTYLVADLFHESGVVATVIAGIVLGNYGRRTSLSARAAVALDTVWEFAAFLLTALAFMLVGLSISIPELGAALPWIISAVVAAQIGRAIVVYGMLGLAWRIGRPQASFALGSGSGWLHVLFWAGLRGAVAVAMALSLPATVPQRELLQEIVFGVVLFTLIVQGMTIEPLVRRWLRPKTTSSG